MTRCLNPKLLTFWKLWHTLLKKSPSTNRAADTSLQLTSSAASVPLSSQHAMPMPILQNTLPLATEKQVCRHRHGLRGTLSGHPAETWHITRPSPPWSLQGEGEEMLQVKVGAWRDGVAVVAWRRTPGPCRLALGERAALGADPARPAMSFHVPSHGDTHCVGTCSFPRESQRCAVSGEARCHVFLQLVGAFPLILMGFGSGPEFSAVPAKWPPQEASPLVLDQGGLSDTLLTMRLLPLFAAELTPSGERCPSGVPIQGGPLPTSSFFFPRKAQVQSWEVWIQCSTLHASTYSCHWEPLCMHTHRLWGT